MPNPAKKTDTCCELCFPDGPPVDAIAVSCEHGAWPGPAADAKPDASKPASE